MHRYLLLIAVSGYLVGCASPQEDNTLGSIDVTNKNALQGNVFVRPKSEDEISQAYRDYINSVSNQDRARLIAINRLAEIEISRVNQAMKTAAETDDVDDRLYEESLERTVELLTTSLRDYPDAADNDRVLYQLARTYDQLGRPAQSMATLHRLADQYPTSSYYAEAQFRTGEQAFLSGDYISAEDAYTEVIYSPENQNFVQRAFFKRGWARYRQSLFQDAVDDHLQAIRLQSFGHYDALNDNEKRLFDEHFRALSLALINLNEPQIHTHFSGHEDREFLFHTHRVIGEIYRQQERYSDVVENWAQYISQSPHSERAVLAQLTIINTWRLADFRNRYIEAVDQFYENYATTSDYWARLDQPELKADALEQFREHAVALTSYHHSRYLADGNQDALNSALIWYARYTTHYADSAYQDNILQSYADLLAAINRHEEALSYYEKAAYDGDIILSKSAAYATVTLSHELYESAPENKASWLDKHLRYSRLFAQLYPNDPQGQAVALHAADVAFTAAQYEEAIALTHLVSDNDNTDAYQSAELIKARSYLELGQFDAAEELLTDLLSGNWSRQQRQLITDNLALTLYKNAEYAQAEGNPAQAIEHFARISQVAPESDIAPKGLYDAAALAMAQEAWGTAITHMESFQQLYPQHELSRSVTQNLSAVYLNAEQYTQAAQALENISAQDQSVEVQMAALWQAAEIYEKENDTEAAIRTYRSYAHSYKRPYPQFMEAMYRLTQLYENSNDDYRRDFWRERIVEAEQSAPSGIKTSRTAYISASALLGLAEAKDSSLRTVRLVEPLNVNLRTKRERMQEAITLYGKASAFNIPEITTQATYAIANIYQHFSEALLDSERPANLSSAELMQYEILIEDQAFPFEEKAIEFYEINIARIKLGVYNEWVGASLRELRGLFPVRYDRQGKLELFRSNSLINAGS